MELVNRNNAGDHPNGDWFFQVLRDIDSNTAAIRISMQRLESTSEENKADIKDHELRLRSIESKMWWAMGACAGLASGLTAIIGKLIGTVG